MDKWCFILPVLGERRKYNSRLVVGRYAAISCLPLLYRCGIDYYQGGRQLQKMVPLLYNHGEGVSAIQYPRSDRVSS